VGGQGNRDVLNYEPRTMAPDVVSRWPPTEVAEGYNYEAVPAMRSLLTPRCGRWTAVP
jgi:hypothetical protein